MVAGAEAEELVVVDEEADVVEEAVDVNKVRSGVVFGTH